MVYEVTRRQENICFDNLEQPLLQLKNNRINREQPLVVNKLIDGAQISLWTTHVEHLKLDFRKMERK